VLARIMRQLRVRSGWSRTTFLAAGFGLILPACGDDGGGGGGSEDGTGGGSADDGGGTADDGGTADGGTADDTGGDDAVGDIEPVPGGMRRLLSTEYVNSVELMLGVEAAAAADPPDDVAQGGWDAVGNAVLSLAAEPVEDYEFTGTQIAIATVANRATLAATVPCVTEGSADSSCYEAVATDLGRFAFRRDLTDDEVTALVEIAEEGRAFGEGDWGTGLKYELMAILQAPSFVYISEIGEETDGEYRLLTGGELATRMSMFLLGRTPDLALLDAADAGELDTEDGIREWAEAMLASSEARVASENFFDEYLRLRFLATLPKSQDIFPAFSESLAASMRQETLLLVNDIVWQNDGDYRDLFDADYTYVDAELAALYGLPAPGGPGFERVDWPEGQGRAGVLSQASFLSLQSGPLHNSPTKRGKFVQSTLLCTVIEPPPPGTNVELPEAMPGETLREQLSVHMKEPSCAACHAVTDPPGFAFEFYDAIGRYRTMDNGGEIDASGSIEGLGEWNSAAELGTLIAESPKMSVCAVQNVIAGNLGFLVTPGIASGVLDLDAAFADADYSLQTMMVELAASPLFRYVDAPK